MALLCWLHSSACPQLFCGATHQEAHCILYTDACNSAPYPSKTAKRDGGKMHAKQSTAHHISSVFQALYLSLLRDLFLFLLSVLCIYILQMYFHTLPLHIYFSYVSNFSTTLSPRSLEQCTKLLSSSQ